MTFPVFELNGKATVSIFFCFLVIVIPLVLILAVLFLIVTCNYVSMQIIHIKNSCLSYNYLAIIIIIISSKVKQNKPITCCQNCFGWL